MHQESYAELTAHERRLVSALAAVDPRTLRRYFEGQARSTTSARIEEALVKIGRGNLRFTPSGSDRDPRESDAGG